MTLNSSCFRLHIRVHADVVSPCRTSQRAAYDAATAAYRRDALPVGHTSTTGAFRVPTTHLFPLRLGMARPQHTTTTPFKHNTASHSAPPSGTIPLSLPTTSISVDIGSVYGLARARRGFSCPHFPLRHTGCLRAHGHRPLHLYTSLPTSTFMLWLEVAWSWEDRMLPTSLGACLSLWTFVHVFIPVCAAAPYLLRHVQRHTATTAAGPRLTRTLPTNGCYVHDLRVADGWASLLTLPVFLHRTHGSSSTVVTLPWLVWFSLFFRSTACFHIAYALPRRPALPRLPPTGSLLSRVRVHFRSTKTRTFTTPPACITACTYLGTTLLYKRTRALPRWR